MTSLKKSIDAWINDPYNSWKKTTRKRYGFQGRYFVRIMKNTYKITAVEKITIKILNKYVKNIAKHRAINTVNNHKRMIMSFLAWCVAKDILLSSPVKHWRLNKNNKNSYSLTQNQMHQILKADYKTDFEKQIKIIIETIYASGIRISEAVSLNLYDIDFGRNILQVKSGKGDKPRILPVIPKLKKSLKKFIETTRQKLAKPNEMSLFVGRRGKRIHQTMIQLELANLSKKINIRFSCHALRRTCATHLLENGVSLAYIKALLGHSCLSTTQKYLNITIDYLETTIAKHPRSHF